MQVESYDIAVSSTVRTSFCILPVVDRFFCTSTQTYTPHDDVHFIFVKLDLYKSRIVAPPPLLSLCVFLPGMKSNPPRLASRLWFTSSYMREGVEGMGEGAYCLTQLASALEFASHVDASVLADITEDELNEVRTTTVCTMMLLCACRCVIAGQGGWLIFSSASFCWMFV